MKKFTLFGVALCASAMVLAGCSKNGDNTGSGDAPSTEPVVNPSITSVTVSPSSASLAPGQKLQASVVVVAVGGAAETVTWSSSDSAKAEVSASGLITAKALGEVTITATSTFDTSKSASVALNVIDKGWSPDLYDEGYTYLEDHSDWPVDDIREFIGTGEYSIAKPDDSVLDEGFYVKETPESTEDYNTYEAVFKGDFGDDVVTQLVSAGGKMYMYEGYFSSWPCVIDASKLFEYDITGYNLSEYYEEGADIDVTSIELYHVSDLFDNAAKTTATDWSAEEKTMFSSAYLPALPFVAFGEDYTFEVDEEEGYVHIYDYNVNWEYLDGYGTLLEAAGFTYDTVADAYYKALPGDNGYISYKVQFGFGGNGNELFYGVDLTPFYESTTPIAKLNAFVAGMKVGSKYVFPTAESMFTKGSAWYYMPSSDGSAFQLMIEGVKKADFDGYKAIFDKFVEDNGVIEHAYVIDESYLDYGYLFVEGYLGATAIMFQYDIEGEQLIAQFSFSGKHENPGLYPSKNKFIFDNVQAEAIDLKAEIEVFALDPIGEFTPVWSFELQTSGAAVEVSDAGVVSPKAVGVDAIKVTYKYGPEDGDKATVTINFEVKNYEVIKFTAADAAATDTSYKAFEKSYGEGAVVLSGVTAKDSNGNIQFNNKDSRGDGIVINAAPTTVIRRVEVDFVSAANPVNFYAASSAITSADLYDIAEPDMQFKVSATNTTAVLTISGAFYHLGVLSSKGMVLAKEIRVIYDSYTPAALPESWAADSAKYGFALTEAEQKYIYYSAGYAGEEYILAPLNAEGAEVLVSALESSLIKAGYTQSGDQFSKVVSFDELYIVYVDNYIEDYGYVDISINELNRWPDALPLPTAELQELITNNFNVKDNEVTFAVASTASYNQIKDAYITVLVGDGFAEHDGNYVKTTSYGETTVSFSCTNVGTEEEPSYEAKISWSVVEPPLPEYFPDFEATESNNIAGHTYQDFGATGFKSTYTFKPTDYDSVYGISYNGYLFLDNYSHYGDYGDSFWATSYGLSFNSDTNAYEGFSGYDSISVVIEFATDYSWVSVQWTYGDIEIPSFLPQGTEDSLKDYLAGTDVKYDSGSFVVEYFLEDSANFDTFKAAYIALITDDEGFKFVETSAGSGIYEYQYATDAKFRVQFSQGSDPEYFLVTLTDVPIE